MFKTSFFTQFPNELTSAEMKCVLKKKLKSEIKYSIFNSILNLTGGVIQYYPKYGAGAWSLIIFLTGYGPEQRIDGIS